MQPFTRWVLSARDGGACLAEQTPLALADPESAASLPSLLVNSERRFQTLLGFGGAFTESAAVTWQSLGAAAREQFLRDCFDPATGHGYTLCRVHMNSCDFSLGPYAHVTTPGDVDLHSFTIERDRQALLPFIQAALKTAGRPVRLLVSPWSPPAWMKSNGEMCNGGKLLAQFRQAWARCFVRFIQAYEAQGVPIWGVSVQNEPAAVQRWDSCIYSAEEERDFVRDHLGPELAAAGLARIKIVIWDHNRDLMVERASVVYSDPEAAKFVWGTGFHWYGENHFDHVQLHHDAWPDKQLLFTEGCQEGGPHTGEWALGERYATSIINDLNRWTVGWIDWNLLLDATGGPNHVGNLCSAPILASPANAAGDLQLQHQSSFWALGHFARFIQPGAQRVLCAATLEALQASAFVNPDGSVVAVLLNRSDAPIRCVVRHGHGVLSASVLVLPARSMASLLSAGA